MRRLLPSRGALPRMVLPRGLRASGLVAAIAIAFSACTTSTPPMADPTPPTGLSCNADAARDAVLGQVASTEVVEQARLAAGAQMARVLKPGQMVTMEYREGRLNIDVDAKNVITNLRCG